MSFYSNTTHGSNIVIGGRTQTKSQASSNKSVNKAIRSGGASGITTESRYGGGGNTQKKTDRNCLALDNDTDTLKHKKVSLDVGKLIQRARNDKGWTQKELATRISEKPQVINQYESGKAIPSTQVINKIQRALNLYIVGKKQGQPMNIAKAKKEAEEKAAKG